jgi:hypothetical protein
MLRVGPLFCVLNIVPFCLHGRSRASFFSPKYSSFFVVTVGVGPLFFPGYSSFFCPKYCYFFYLAAILWSKIHFPYCVLPETFHCPRHQDPVPLSYTTGPFFPYCSAGTFCSILNRSTLFPYCLLTARPFTHPK